MSPAEFPPFLPCQGLASAHLQTLIASYTRPRIPYRAARHTVPLGDGDAIVLHDDRPALWCAGDRVVLLLHGVAGCHGSPYLVRTAHKLNLRHWRTFRMDQRGRGAGSRLARQPGHAGRSGDARTAVTWIARHCPGSPITIVGFSMGGNIVLKLLGEAADGLPPELDSALAVAPPVDLLFCARNLDRGLARLYSRGLTRMLLRGLDQRACLGALARPLPDTPRRLWDFDDWITAPLSGFESAEAYYTTSSSAPLLHQIRLPTLIVTAADDPLIPVEMFRHHAMSPAISLHLTENGGHVGFLGRRGLDPDRWWLDWRIVDWIGHHHATP
jgi:predicted alpha/beta-fold hydrolase